MRYASYPGCSSEHLASAYQDSLRQVADFFQIELSTVPDWNCCGATEYNSIDRLSAYALCARNLALVPEGSEQLVTPCSACYLNLKRTDFIMAENPDMNRDINLALSAGRLNYTPGRFEIRHVLDMLINDVGLDAIGERVSSPLTGLRVAPYYGCMLVRPGNGFDHPEYPVSMDRLLRALGAEVVDFSMKAYCCGGHMPHIKAMTGYEILRRILQDAEDKGSDIIVVACPVCQLNLEAYQEDVNKNFGTNFSIPVMFFTQLMGLAFGMTHQALGIGKELVSAEPVLLRKRSPAVRATSKTFSRAAGLPMPEPKGEK
jgi:heterodisulfide reductase subunit B